MPDSNYWAIFLNLRNMIIELKHATDAITNHKQMGKVSTDEFNSIIVPIVMNIQGQLFAEFRKLNIRKGKFQDTPNYGNEAGHLKQAIEYYVNEKEVNLTAGKVNLIEAIDDFLMVNSVFTNNAQAEKVDLLQFNQLSKLAELNPTNCMPVFTLNSNVIKVSPAKEKVSVTYYRKAKTPKLTSRIFNETEVYDDSANDFQDLDIHPIMFQNALNELLAYFGVNLQDQFAMQLSAQLKQEEQLKAQ